MIEEPDLKKVSEEPKSKEVIKESDSKKRKLNSSPKPVPTKNIDSNNSMEKQSLPLSAETVDQNNLINQEDSSFSADMTEYINSSNQEESEFSAEIVEYNIPTEDKPDFSLRGCDDSNALDKTVHNFTTIFIPEHADQTDSSNIIPKQEVIEPLNAPILHHKKIMLQVFSEESN